LHYKKVFSHSHVLTSQSAVFLERAAGGFRSVPKQPFPQIALIIHWLADKTQPALLLDLW
jgi:hypothetical protein